MNIAKQDAMNKRTYEVKEIAQILGISRTTAYKVIREGYFQSVRVGSCIRISKASFDHWLDSHQERNI